MKTFEQLQQEYRELSAKVGDLYFVMENHRGLLRQMESQMAQYHVQRDAIQAEANALAAATPVAPAAPESPPSA